MPEVFDVLDGLVEAGKLKHYGVSVEKVEEGLKAIEYPGVASIQIIYNIFRQRPERLFFREAKAKGVAVIVRVPLASGLLTGKMTRDTHFAADDHRTFNRARREVRRGRDLLRRALRGGPGGGRGTAAAGAGGRDDGGFRAPLDPDERRGDGGDPRARRTPRRRGPTPPPPTCRRSRRRRWRR